VSQSSSSIEQFSLSVNCAVHSIVVYLAQFGVEHKIGHGIVGVSMEIFAYIVCSIVKDLFPVALVSFKFMGINQEVKEFKNTILKSNYFLTVWVEIIWEVVESLYIHYLHPDCKKWKRDWVFLEVTPHGFKV
jgi:hypothetical protein